MDREGAAFPKLLAKDFARIMQQIELLWGKLEAFNYLDSLILDSREGRQGFPLEALREIALVKHVHSALFPSLELNPHDPSSALSRGKWPKVCTQHDLSKLAKLRQSGKVFYEQQGKPIGEILIHYGFIDKKTLLIARRMQERPEHQDKPLGQVLVEIGIVKQEDMVCALCIQSRVIMVDLLATHISPKTIKLIPGDKAREKQVVPVGVYNGTLFLAVADPFDFNDKSFFTMLTGLNVEPIYAPRLEIVNRLNMYGSGRSSLEAKEEFRNLAQKTYDSMPSTVESDTPGIDISENDATVVNLVNKMILSAIDEGASDIHIELFQNSEAVDIRFRRDGNMENFSSFPRTYHPAVVSRIKVMAGMDISERRRPQDGKISITMPEGNRIDLRVATVPAMRGIEFVTIRILASGNPLPLSDIGMTARDLDIFRETAHHTYGLILVCGPTGSGKTTTLHSVIKELNTSDRKIWTVEDPVEIVQPHLCQVEVNNKIGVTFASLLRSLLRADPDIIMIGEMRDQETAKIALEASMTGHLVLSTLHTNSASETVARLLDLGIDPFNLSDALLSILAQRLARKLCDECAKREEAAASHLDELANEYHQSAHGTLPARMEREALIRGWIGTYGEEGKLYIRHPVGCKVCTEGYKGRIGLYELLQITPAVRRLIRLQSPATEYQAAGIAEGMRTLKQDGIEKILCGITDITQVHRACA